MPLSDPGIGGALQCRRTQAAVEICDPCHVLPGLPWGLGGMFSLAGGAPLGRPENRRKSSAGRLLPDRYQISSPRSLTPPSAPRFRTLQPIGGMPGFGGRWLARRLRISVRRTD